MKIGELACRAGLNPSALRYYDVIRHHLGTSYFTHD